MLHVSGSLLGACGTCGSCVTGTTRTTGTWWKKSLIALLQYPLFSLVVHQGLNCHKYQFAGQAGQKLQLAAYSFLSSNLVLVLLLMKTKGFSCGCFLKCHPDTVLIFISITLWVWIVRLSSHARVIFWNWGWRAVIVWSSPKELCLLTTNYKGFPAIY